MTTHETYVHAGRMPVERMAPCGDERLSLTYSGSTYTFRGLSPQQRTTAEHRFAALASEPTANPRAVEVHVCAALPNTFRSFDRRGWEYCLAASHEGGQTWLSGMGFVARIDAAPTRETVLWVDPDLGELLAARGIDFFPDDAKRHVKADNGFAGGGK